VEIIKIKKKNKALSVSQSVPVVVTCFMSGKFRFQILRAGSKSNVFKCLKRRLLSSFAEYKEHVEPCCMVLRRTMQGRKTYARRQKKTGARQTATNTGKCLKRRLLSSFAEYKEHVEPCCMVLCRTMQGRKTYARRQKNTGA
jgi:hypothetical protein